MPQLTLTIMRRISRHSRRLGAFPAQRPSFGYFLRVSEGTAGVCHRSSESRSHGSRGSRSECTAIANARCAIGEAVRSRARGSLIETNRRIVDEVAAHTCGKAVLLASLTSYAAPHLLAASRGLCDIVAFRNFEQIGRLRAFLDIVQFRR